MSIQRCRTCARCAGGRSCKFQDGYTKGCSNYEERVNPYSEKKVVPTLKQYLEEHWATYKKTDIDDKGDK